MRVLAVVFAELLFVSAAFISPPLDAAPPRHVERPFLVGERAVYDVNYGFIHAGTGSLDVVGIDTVRGRGAYRFRLTFSAGVPHLYSIRDTMQSWVDTAIFQSLRFHQDQLEGGKTRTKRYEIYPDRQVYTDAGRAEQPSVAEPLDDISFLYFIRTQSIEVGETVTYPRYFKPESNPVKLIALRKEVIEAAGRKWNTLVMQPIIKTSSGIFSEGGKAQVWISDDSARVIVQINTRLSVGSINMKLKSYQPSATPPAPGDAVGK